MFHLKYVYMSMKYFPSVVFRLKPLAVLFLCTYVLFFCYTPYYYTLITPPQSHCITLNNHMQPSLQWPFLFCVFLQYMHMITKAAFTHALEP